MSVTHLKKRARRDAVMDSDADEVEIVGLAAGGAALIIGAIAAAGLRKPTGSVSPH